MHAVRLGRWVRGTREVLLTGLPYDNDGEVLGLQ